MGRRRSYMIGALISTNFSDLWIAKSHGFTISRNPCRANFSILFPRTGFTTHPMSSARATRFIGCIFFPHVVIKFLASAYGYFCAGIVAHPWIRTDTSTTRNPFKAFRLWVVCWVGNGGPQTNLYRYERCSEFPPTNMHHQWCATAKSIASLQCTNAHVPATAGDFYKFPTCRIMQGYWHWASC